MIRAAIGIFLVAVLIVVVIALNGEPGSAGLTWLGWEVRTTAAAAVLLIGLMALAATIFWRGVLWLIESPARAARARAESRRRQGGEALSRGFLAAAAGDGAEARRMAQRAAGLADESPQLVRLLAAKAAEAALDSAGARAAYSAMLGFPEMRLAAHKGLMQSAASDGDAAEALAQAQAAYDLPRTAAWAWRALLHSRLKAADWTGALELAQGALERKIVSPLLAERARAALLTAQAAGLEADGDPRRRAQGLDLAAAAVKARPDFAPGAVLAARLVAADGRVQRAAQILEAAWKGAAHPALWMAWRDLKTDETPRERAARLAALAAENPGPRESRILMVEQALIAGDPGAARAAAAALEGEATTARLAGLMARVSAAGGDRDEARAWIARGAAAPQEAEWSDIDPSGRAFAYGPADWAAVILAYVETGALAHPRHERHEETISDLPQIPAAYADSAPFISAAEAGDPFPPIFDDGGFGEDLQPASGEQASRRVGALGAFRGGKNR